MQDGAPRRLCATVLGTVVAVAMLAGCAAEADPVARAQAQVTAKEKAVDEAESAFTAASDEFCQASETYIEALDRYGDVLHDTAPTVGDVRAAGSDLAAPRDDALDGAEAAVAAQDDLVAAQQDLLDAQAKLAELQGTTGEPIDAGAEPSATPLAPASSVERVKQAESDFADAEEGITDQTPLTDAAEQFNAAAVALELSWLRLFVDTGCVSDEQAVQAEAAVRAYTTALQQDLATAGYYTGQVDGIYGPLTVQAVEDLQTAAGLPVTGAMDKATTEALQEALVAKGDAAAQESVASTAAVQQTLKLAGYWDGPIDGVWTPELTAAVQEFQTALGVEPTGTVDAATVSAFQQALAELQAGPSPSPSASA